MRSTILNNGTKQNSHKATAVGLTGLAMIAALSNQGVRGKISDSFDLLGDSINFTYGMVDDYRRFGTYSTDKYRLEQSTLDTSNTPLELSEGNPFVAEYIRRTANVPSVKNSINPGITFTSLKKDDNGTPGYILMGELGTSQK